MNYGKKSASKKRNSLISRSSMMGKRAHVSFIRVLFIGLIALMCVILIEGKISVSSKKAEAAKPAQAAPAPAAKPEPVPAPGAAGELKLHNVPAKDAAILMAIVAYKLGKPVNELRFKSIKEVQ